jgi:hypothetical protein
MKTRKEIRLKTGETLPKGLPVAFDKAHDIAREEDQEVPGGREHGEPVGPRSGLASRIANESTCVR